MAGRTTRFKSVCSIHTAVRVTNGSIRAYRITLAGVSEIVSPHKTSENKNAVISGVLFRPKVTGVRIAVPIMAIISQAKYAKCAISLSSGNGGTVRGTGSYSYGSTVTISAIPNEGYMFEGWYENGRCLDNISDDYTFTAFTNRTIEAKFVPNDLTISNIEVIGDMEPETALVFSAKAEGGYQPYVWEYTIYNGDTPCYTLSDSTFDYLEWSPTETGNYTIVVCVTDKTGFKATYSKQFSII